MRTTIDPGLIRKMRAAKAQHGSNLKAARALGIGESTVSKYTRDDAPAPGAGEDDLDALAERIARKLGLGAPPAEGPPAPALAPGAKPDGLTVTIKARPRKLLYISDVHYPWQDDAAIGAVLAFAHDYKPDLVVLGGDILDCYSISRWPKSPERRHTLQDEADAAQSLIKGIDALGCDVHFIDGNHEDRIGRHVAEQPGLYKLRGFDVPGILGLPKRWKHHRNQTHLRVGNLIVHHGDLAGGGGGGVHAANNMLRRLRTSNLCGHWHRLDAYYAPDYDGTPQVGLVNGHLSDVASQTYIRSPLWTQGVTTVEFHWDPACFAATQHPVVRGRILAGGTLHERNG